MAVEGFNLTEEELPLAFRLGPILEELARRRRYAKISTFAPQADVLADAVDDLVLLDAVLRPFGVESKLLAVFLVGWAMGMKYELIRRSSTMSFVMPSSSKRVVLATARRRASL